MMPSNAQARKDIPIYTGLVKYFPDALVEIARASFVGQQQHNPDLPLAWDRSKSGDELDALMRHLLEAGKTDGDGIRHSAKVAWRALAHLQKEIEAERHQDAPDATVTRINGKPQPQRETPPEIASEPELDTLRQRVRDYLEEWGVSINSADLGVPKSTLYHFMNGAGLNESNHGKLVRALDEADAVFQYDTGAVDTDAGDFLADEVNDFLYDNGYNLDTGAMALNVSRDVLDSVTDGFLPHPNIINALGNKLPQVLAHFSWLKDGWLAQQEGAA